MKKHGHGRMGYEFYSTITLFIGMKMRGFLRQVVRQKTLEKKNSRTGI